VSANDDRAFNHRGFHLGPPETPPSPVMDHNGDSKTEEVAEYRPRINAVFCDAQHSDIRCDV
jgi:hypothetical protein